MKHPATISQSEVNSHILLIGSCLRSIVKLKSDTILHDEPVCVRKDMCVGVYTHRYTQNLPWKDSKKLQSVLGETLKGALKSFHFCNSFLSEFSTISVCCFWKTLQKRVSTLFLWKFKHQVYSEGLPPFLLPRHPPTPGANMANSGAHPCGSNTDGPGLLRKQDSLIVFFCDLQMSSLTDFKLHTLNTL